MSAFEESHDLTVPARAAATAWLNAFLATSDDEERPALYRTLSLEWFHDGLQIVCTNGHALFRSWCPIEAGARWPGQFDRPRYSALVLDLEGFGRTFMQTLLSVTKDEAHEHEQLQLSVAPWDDGANLSLGAAFTGQRLILRSCGQRIDLRVSEGKFPDWRHLQLGVDEVERVDELLLATSLFQIVGKIRGASSVDMRFKGDKKAIVFQTNGEPSVKGLLMPMLKRGEETKKVEKVEQRELGAEPATAYDVRERDDGVRATVSTAGVNGGRPMPLDEFTERVERGEIVMDNDYALRDRRRDD